MEEQLERIMRGLHCSVEEAKAVLEYDKRVERGEKTEYELTPEQEKAAKKYRSTGTRKTGGWNFPKKERPRQADQEQVIAALVSWLESQAPFQAEDITKSIKGYKIDFTVGPLSYTLTLTKHRPPKK